MSQAVCKACGKKVKPSSRDKAAAKELLAAGYTAEQISLMAPDGDWFTKAKPFGPSKNPLHRSQLIEYIEQCLAWHKNPTSHETEYSYAAAQPKATGEEVVSRSRRF